MAEDIARPLCKCHGEPMVRNSYQPDGRQKWGCGIKRRQYGKNNYWDGPGAENRRELAASRKRAGLCVRCGVERLLGEALCWTCMNYMEARVA